MGGSWLTGTVGGCGVDTIAVMAEAEVRQDGEAQAVNGDRSMLAKDIGCGGVVRKEAYGRGRGLPCYLCVGYEAVEQALKSSCDDTLLRNLCIYRGYSNSVFPPAAVFPTFARKRGLEGQKGRGPRREAAGGLVDECARAKKRASRQNLESAADAPSSWRPACKRKEGARGRRPMRQRPRRVCSFLSRHSCTSFRNNLVPARG